MHMKCKPNERSLMLSSDKLYKYLVKLWPVKLDKENCQEVADTSRIHEFLMMKTTNITGSSVIQDLKNFVEELQKSV